jgi:predicted transcriptional regulator
LLQAVDRTAEQTERSRSAVFEDALLLWYEKMQEEADRAFYSKESEDPAVQNWEQVTAKAAGHLWDD